MKPLIYLLPLLMLAAACRKRPDPVAAATTPGTGQLSMEITNRVGNVPMILDTVWYQNALGDSFRVTTFKYYVSNISLKTITGETFTEPESYHLIDQRDAATRKITISNVPAGSYTSATFLIGVDSAHNTSGAQAGDLDPAKGMLWSWNTGYIMAKMEGIAPKCSTADHHFYYHIAGFSGTSCVLRWVTLTFPNTANVTPTRKPNVHLFADANEWFQTPRNIRFSDNSEIMTVGDRAAWIADNYQDMFSVNHIDE